jgi:predicted Zn-dependent protease
MSNKHRFEISFYESILKKEPKYVEVIELLGGLYTSAGRIEDGLKMDRKLVRLRPDNPVVHYNLACSLALKRRFKESLERLKLAVELGYRDLQWILEDPDLENLRTHPAFQRLLKQIKSIQ